MKLLSLQLTDFKGIKSFILSADGRDVAIYGDNATGKTTIADAFYFLLFGKDSLSRKEFEVLPLDMEGNRIPDIVQAEVEGTFDIDGRQVVLKRIFAEKWTKKRGQANKEFAGHETLYYIDGVPKKQKEYEAAIAEIADTEEAFKLLTNPRYFCEVLTWQKRREILLEVCGDISDEDVIARNENLSGLQDVLNGLTIDDFRIKTKSKLSELNGELKTIPVRIDEVNKGLPAEQEHPIDSELAQKRKALLEKKARIETGGEIAEQTKIMREIEADIQRLMNEGNASGDAEKRKYKQNIGELQAHITGLRNQIKGNTDMAKRNATLIETIERDLVSMRAEYAEAYKQEFAGNDTCPTCRQPLPADQIEAARAKFNLDKSKRLEKINADGKAMKKRLDTLKAEVAGITEKNAEIEQSIAASETAIKEQEECLAALDAESPEVKPTIELENRRVLLKDTQDKIAKLKADKTSAVAAVQAEINGIDSHIAEGERIQAQNKQRANGLKRIEELKAQQKTVAAEYEKLAQQLYLTDKFVQQKVSLLTDRINSCFSIARFKLFEMQINGGLSECCEVTFDGIPYDAGLNNGARINAGLDIIDTLSNNADFAPPIFIDNAEAVTRIKETNGQQIRLYVSPEDPELRIEISDQTANA